MVTANMARSRVRATTTVTHKPICRAGDCNRPVGDGGVAAIGEAREDGIGMQGFAEIADVAGHHCRPRPYRQWCLDKQEREPARQPAVIREGMGMSDGKSGLQLRTLLKKSGE